MIQPRFSLLTQTGYEMLKRPVSNFPAGDVLLSAMLGSDSHDSFVRYFESLRLHGIHLPPGLECCAGSSLCLRYRWVVGTSLRRIATIDGEAFWRYVECAGEWALELAAHTPYRIDLNLDNFVVGHDGQLTLVDVIPPIDIRRMPLPTSNSEAILFDLCASVRLSLDTLLSYAFLARISCSDERDSYHRKRLRVTWKLTQLGSSLLAQMVALRFAAIDAFESGLIDVPAVLQVFQKTSLRTAMTSTDGICR